MSLDVALALGISALAAAWLVRRGVRRLRAKSGAGCDCPSAGACGPKGPSAADLKAAAARAMDRVNRDRPVVR